ncbi:MAG: Ig-like domain-containing protein, partial [Candidatus Puniceispirillaceae bacterium]
MRCRARILGITRRAQRRAQGKAELCMRRTDIIGDITGDRQSEGRGEARTLPKTNWQPGRATTSLTPYGMSFWALILAACGGGGGGGGGGRPTTAGASQMLQREGYVYDGPVKGAVVYVDADDDGQLNPGRDEYVGTTDSSGAFRGSISAQNRGKRYIVDLTRAKDLGNDKIEGTADDQDLSKFGTWLAPEGASVVSALTHLIAKGVYKEQEVKSTFPGFDPLRDKPYKQGLTPDKEKAFEIVRKALPGITRLVKEHSDLIEENTRRIERNSEDLEALKDELNALKAQVSAIKEAAAQPDPAPPNTLPTAADDNAGPVDEGATVRGNVRANDRDAETARDSLVVNAVWAGDGTGGAAGRIGEALQGVYGRLTLNADGGYSYVAGTNADRPVDDVFTYRIADADGGVHTAKLTIRVNGVAPPNTEQPGPTNPSSDMPSSLTLGFENRNSGQRIDETTDISQTVEPIKTGLVLTSSVSGLFAAARGNGDNRPIINILSRQQDGSFVVDNDRFTIRENGKLSVKRYAHLDYESEHNPNGQIDLRIVVSYNNGPSAVQHISVFLNNLNDAPVGELRLVQYANGNPTPVETRLFEYLSVPVNTRIGFDKNGFSDPDRNTLTYTTKWISPDRITVSSEDTFTPDRSGQYYLQVEVSDGRITTPIRHLVIF